MTFRTKLPPEFRVPAASVVITLPFKKTVHPLLSCSAIETQAFQVGCRLCPQT